MTSNPLQQTIEALAKEKGIEPEVVIQAMEEAVLTASRKFYKGDEVLFESEGGKLVRLPLSLISRARLDVEF